VVAFVCPVDMSMSNVGHEHVVCFSFGKKLVAYVFEFEISEGLIQIYFLVYAYATSLPLSGRPASTACCTACDRSTYCTVVAAAKLDCH
jgi:hypothetical protein